VFRFDRATAIDGVTERIDNAAKERFANRNLHDFFRTLNGVTLFDTAVFAEDNDTNGFSFKVQDHAEDFAGKLNELARHCGFEAVNARHTVTDRENASGFADFDRLVVSFDLFFENFADFVSPNIEFHL
jgi:hypothetical protein